MSSELVPFHGLWIASHPISILGMPLSATMTVVRLAHGGLLLVSPIARTPSLAREVEALGEVTDLYAPNTFHHGWIGEWAAAHPEARIHAPEALAANRPDLRVARAHDVTRDHALSHVLEEIHVEGFRLEETLLVHRESGTLIVADLVHNIGAPSHAWTRLYAGAMGFYGRVALSRMIRWTAFSDRRAAARSLSELAATPFDRVIVGHGTPLEEGGRDAVLEAYAWLDHARPTLALPSSRHEPSPCG